MSATFPPQRIFVGDFSTDWFDPLIRDAVYLNFLTFGFEVDTAQEGGTLSLSLPVYLARHPDRRTVLEEVIRESLTR